MSSAKCTVFSGFAGKEWRRLLDNEDRFDVGPAELAMPLKLKHSEYGRRPGAIIVVENYSQERL